MLNLEKILYRIILGYYYIEINDQIYKVITPSLDIKYRAEILFDKTIEDNKYDKRWLNDDEIKYYLLINNIWMDKDDKRIKEVEKIIEDNKIDLFKNFSNSKTKNKLKKDIQSLKKSLNKLYSRKKTLDYLGIHDYALSIKNEFIVMNCVYDERNHLVFDRSETDCDFSKLQSFVKEIIDASISVEDMKTLVKSSLWRSYSACCDFNRDILNINDDYKYLINLHKMYDNARQHPEAPSEDIIEDDDALDGWFLFQNRKAEKEKKKQSALSKFDNKKFGQHNFIFAENQEEANTINELNDDEEKIFAKQLIEYSKNNPGAKWQDIPVIRRQLEQELELMRGNKK